LPEEPGSEFPPSVLTRSRTGKLEVRSLDSKGRYILCKYLDPKTLKPADRKKKLSLMDEHGTLREYFIIPLKGEKKFLMVEAEKEEKERKVWNEKTGVPEDLWE